MTAQPLIALAKVQAVRSQRAALERGLAATRRRAAAIAAGLAAMASSTPRVAGMGIRVVALFGVGRVRVQMVLDVTDVDPATALGALTVDDRRRLTRALAGLVGPRVRLHGAAGA